MVSTNIRLLRATTLIPFVMMFCIAHAANTDLRVFIGTWKEDSTKSKHSISDALSYTFTAEADGFVSIVRGNTPVHDLARFDGQDYPSGPNRTASWTKVTDTVYDSTIKTNGTLIASARWTLSEHGTHLAQATAPVRANGDNDINMIDYVRVAGEGNTLLGVWKPLASRSTVPDLFTITLVNDELQVFYPKYGYVVYTMRLDGQRYPLTSPNAAAGASSMAEGLGRRSVRHVSFLGEMPGLEVVMDVSADGKTLTAATRPAGSSVEPNVTVYDKQP